MIAIIYTYPDDYLMAGFSALMLARQGIKVVIAISAGDPPFACEHATVVRTSFDRRGNLNGREFILGHLRLMQEHASGEYAYKLDSDTLLLDAANHIAGRTEVAVGIWAEGMAGMQGCCYAIRVDAIPAMIEQAANLDTEVHLMEDKTMGELAALVGPVHLPKWRSEGSRYTVHNPEMPVEWHRERFDVVTFKFDEEKGKAAVAREMKKFL